MSKKSAAQSTKHTVQSSQAERPVIVGAESAAKKTFSEAKQEVDVIVAEKEKMTEVPVTEKMVKIKKTKLIRDSFTIPEADYALFLMLRQRALSVGVEVKKGEILRAALLVLAKLDDVELIKAIGLVERIKTGRPKK